MTVTSAQRKSANRTDETTISLQSKHRRGRVDVPALLTLDETAKILRVHRNTVNHERRAGRLPVVRVGRRVLIDPADLEHYIKQRREAICPNPNTTDCMSIAATTSSAVPTHQTSTYIGADRARAGSDAEARARAIFNKPSHD